jgi:hypothetical protein
MRMTRGFLPALCLMAGCSFAPPKPPQCRGEFRPVNAPAYQGVAMLMSREDSLALCTKGGQHADQG